MFVMPIVFPLRLSPQVFLFPPYHVTASLSAIDVVFAFCKSSDHSVHGEWEVH